MKIIKLKFKDYEAEINLSRGANCISFRETNYRISVLREADYTKELDNPFVYGMPILFPPNRISNGEFEFEGRTYSFPVNEPETNCHLHGLLHDTEFELIEQGESFVRCKYDSDVLYEFFPHKFRVEMMYSLSEQGLTQKTRLYNLSATNMPVFLGFHTTFNLPFIHGADKKAITVFAEISDEIERNMVNYLPTGRGLPDDDIAKQLRSGEFIPFGNKIRKHYKADKKGRIEILDAEKGLKIVYLNDEKFGWRVFYNGNADEFICLEAQTCMVNCQNSELDRAYTGFDSIEPQSYKEYVSQIYVEKMK